MCYSHAEQRKRDIQLHQMVVQLAISFDKYFVSDHIQLGYNFQITYVSVVTGAL